MDPRPAVKDSVIDPAAFVAQIEAAGRVQGFRVDRFGECDGVPQVALTKRSPGPRPRIYLSAGIHGDEPAPPLTLLELIRSGFFDARAVWFLCPLLNPLGFRLSRRENAAGIDLNRDYKSPRSTEIQAHARWLQHQPNFDLAICLHEDWESRGFYLYELSTPARPGFARALIAAAATVCPIEAATEIDGRKIDEPGIIRPIADPSLRDAWPESIYLQAHHTRLGYTVETPSALPLAQRTATLAAVIGEAVRLTSAECPY